MSTDIKSFLEETATKFTNLKLISLTTADGFPIYNDIRTHHEVDKESISAVSSSLISLSNAAAKQLIGSTLEAVTLETKEGNMFLCNTEYKGKKCVLCVATGIQNNIGHARYFTQQVAQQLTTQ